MAWIKPNGTISSLNTIRYTYIQDNGVVAYYQFNDGSCSSRQLIADTETNMNISVEFYKEFEILDGVDQHLSRWSAQINIKRLKEENPIEGFPIFFIAKEGALKGEDDYLTYEQNEDQTFSKVYHQVANPLPDTYTVETLEMGSSTKEQKTFGVRVPEDEAW